MHANNIVRLEKVFVMKKVLKIFGIVFLFIAFLGIIKNTKTIATSIEGIFLSQEKLELRTKCSLLKSEIIKNRFQALGVKENDKAQFQSLIETANDLATIHNQGLECSQFLYMSDIPLKTYDEEK